jgi:hypothetical protein
MTSGIKIGLLVALLLVWGGLLAMRLGFQEEQARVPLKFTSGTSTIQHSGPLPGVTPVAKLATLREAETVFRTPKNIFGPLGHPQERHDDPGPQQRGGHAKARAASAVIASPPPPPPSQEELAAQRAHLQREQAMQLARQLMGQYRFIGFLMQNGEPRAFLGKGRELYIVRAGEVLEGQIQVATIESSSLKLRDVASDLESALPLTR